MKDEECFIVKDDPDIAYKAIGQSCPVCRDFFCIYCESFCHLSVYIRYVNQKRLKRTVRLIKQRAMFWFEKSVMFILPKLRKDKGCYVLDIVFFNIYHAELLTVSAAFEELQDVTGVGDCIRFNNYSELRKSVRYRNAENETVGNALAGFKLKE